MFDIDVINFIEGQFEEVYKQNTILVFDHQKAMDNQRLLQLMM